MKNLSRILKVMMALIMALGCYVAVANFLAKDLHAGTKIGTWVWVEGLGGVCIGEPRDCIEMWPDED